MQFIFNIHNFVQCKLYQKNITHIYQNKMSAENKSTLH